jgi:hypothetical protein
VACGGRVRERDAREGIMHVGGDPRAQEQRRARRAGPVQGGQALPQRQFHGALAVELVQRAGEGGVERQRDVAPRLAQLAPLLLERQPPLGERPHLVAGACRAASVSAATVAA